MKRIVSLPVLLVSLLANACSGDESPSAASNTGGSGGDGAGGYESGGTGGIPTTLAPCTQTSPAKRVASVIPLAASLRVSGQDLFVIDGEGNGFPTIVRRIDAAGNKATLHDSGADCTPSGLALGPDDVFFLDDCVDGTTALKRIPKTGGTAAVVMSLQGYDGGGAEVVSATREYAYLYVSGTPKNRILEVTLSNGSTREIARHEGSGFENIQIYGQDVWFSARQGIAGIVHAPLDASNPDGTGKIDPTTCVFSFTVTSKGVFCSDPVSLYRIGLNGQDRAAVLQLENGAVNVSRPDGNFIYLLPMGSPDSPQPIAKYPIAGGAPKTLACSGAVVTELGFNDTSVFWLERVDLDAAIYSAPK